MSQLSSVELEARPDIQGAKNIYVMTSRYDQRGDHPYFVPLICQWPDLLYCCTLSGHFYPHFKILIHFFSFYIII